MFTTPPPKSPSPSRNGAARPLDRRMLPLIRSFGYAFAGLWHLLRTQRNAQIHLLVGACACALGLFLPLARWEWLALLLTSALVLAAEGFNTALEAAVDLAAPSQHPLAKVAKDVAAGTVLLCALAAVVVGCVVFLPHLWDLRFTIYDLRLLP
jgi:diacylglycerol kinase (ATP)